MCGGYPQRGRGRGIVYPQRGRGRGNNNNSYYHRGYTEGTERLEPSPPPISASASTMDYVKALTSGITPKSTSMPPLPISASTSTSILPQPISTYAYKGEGSGGYNNNSYDDWNYTERTERREPSPPPSSGTSTSTANPTNDYSSFFKRMSYEVTSKNLSCINKELENKEKRKFTALNVIPGDTNATIDDIKQWGSKDILTEHTTWAAIKFKKIKGSDPKNYKEYSYVLNKPCVNRGKIINDQCGENWKAIKEKQDEGQILTCADDNLVPTLSRTGKHRFHSEPNVTEKLTNSKDPRNEIGESSFLKFHIDKIYGSDALSSEKKAGTVKIYMNNSHLQPCNKTQEKTFRPKAGLFCDNYLDDFIKKLSDKYKGLNFRLIVESAKEDTRYSYKDSKKDGYSRKSKTNYKKSKTNYNKTTA